MLLFLCQLLCFVLFHQLPLIECVFPVFGIALEEAVWFVLAVVVCGDSVVVGMIEIGLL